MSSIFKTTVYYFIDYKGFEVVHFLQIIEFYVKTFDQMINIKSKAILNDLIVLNIMSLTIFLALKTI